MNFFRCRKKGNHIPLNTTAAVAPIAPKKGEYAGHSSVGGAIVMKVEKYRKNCLKNRENENINYLEKKRKKSLCNRIM